MVVVTELLAPFRCANPECPSKRTGKGQIVMRGDNRPGWRGEAICHQCRCRTFVEIDEQGLPHYIVRPRDRNA